MALRFLFAMKRKARSLPYISSMCPTFRMHYRYQQRTVLPHAASSRRWRSWIAFAFGFIHGFGFANVLREMELPGRALGWSLFSFNFGVEIGQLLVVVTVASAFAVLRARSEWARRRLVYAGSILVIIAGAFWFIQRVFFPAGIS